MPGPKGRASLGQHFLAPDVAERVVADAGVSATDVIVEIGAGDGALTRALAQFVACVIAVEKDAGLAGRLASRFAAHPGVVVVAADFFDMPLPASPFRVVANIPFGCTGPMLRRLLDEPSGLVRADVVVQWQVARSCARMSAGPPTDLSGARWGPWWEFRRGRRLPAWCFRPQPGIDAAVIVVERRARPLLAVSERVAYDEFVRALFARPVPLLGRRLPRDLSVSEIVSLFSQRRRKARRRGPSASR